MIRAWPPEMPLVSLFMILALFAFPCAAAAQPWADAYRTGDYRKAADLLQLVIIDQHDQMPFADPAPARHLAMLYSKGLGVPRDPIAACALAQTADMATRLAASKQAESFLAYEARHEESQRFVRDHCDGLTQQDRIAAGYSLGCPVFGMPEEALTVGGQTVWVGRGGIRLTREPAETGAGVLGCGVLVVRVRPLTIAPPSDAAPGVRARHFVELLVWEVGQDQRDSTRQSALQWQMYEIRGAKIDSVAREYLFSIAQWPRPGLPPEYDARFSVEMIRSGHVRWRMDGAPPKRGWIMLPEKET
jgi:hypothetical protein